jgi:SAM-dependent methyltransferase
MPQGSGTPYTDEFYRRHRDVSLRSAREIVPLVLRLVQPRSVVDVGCGIGTWLSVFREHGVRDVCGMDGGWVDTTMLIIPEDRFLAVDLRRPLPVDRRFDLAVSVEVAEHLPDECARTFVDSLTRLAPVVLFSAAIPFQGGTGHINEQWPEYWVKYFSENGYAVVDCIRRTVWQNPNVEWYYAQNALMFVSPDFLMRSPALHDELARTATGQLSLVHPRKYLEAIADMRRLLLTTQDIAAVIPPGDRFILVDHDTLRRELAFGRPAIPFLERDGQYWGPPGDDMTAIREVERLRREGAGFIIFVWPAFWWLDYYSKFNEYLRSRFPCVSSTERLVAFDLRG